MPIIAAESPNAVGDKEFKADALGQISIITAANPLADGDTAIPAGSHLLIFPDGVPVGAWVDQADVVHFAGSAVTVAQPDLLSSDPSGHLTGFSTFLSLPDDDVARASSDATGELPSVEDPAGPVDPPIDNGDDLPPITAPPDDPTDQTGTPPPDPVGTGTDPATTPPVTPPATGTDDPTTSGLVTLSHDFAAMVLHVGQHTDQPTLLHDASALVVDATAVFAQLLPHVDASPEAAAAAKTLADAFGEFLNAALDFPASGIPGTSGPPATGSPGTGPTVPPPVVTDPQPSQGGWHGCGWQASDHGQMVAASGH